MSLLETYLRHYPWALRLKRARWWRHSKALMAVERACFDEQMRSSENSLRELVKDKTALVMVLCEGSKVVGYIAGVPLESESSSFDADTDPQVGWGDHDTIYVDNISILPEHRDKHNLRFMVEEYIRFAKRAGYLQATAHVRKSNGLAIYCIRKLKFKRLQTIEDWYECGEAFDYLHFPKGVMAEHKDLPVWHIFISAFRRLFAGTAVERHFQAKES